VRRAALALVALALTGCETTAEKSARLERAALAHARPARSPSGAGNIGAPSRKLHVVATTLLRGPEGLAAVVTVRNASARAQMDAPISLAVRGAGDSSVYTNREGGLARSLTTLPLIPAHGEVSWVDDQVRLTAPPSGIAAQVGEGTAAKAPGALAVSGQPPVREPGGGEAIAGRVVNRTGTEQRELVVFALARRGGRIVGAGRAVLASLAAGASSPFQIFLTGTARGAQVELSAPASSAG